MKKILILLIALFIFPFSLFAAEMQKTYSVVVVYDQGNLSLGNITVGRAYVPEDKPEAEMSSYRYWLEILSFEGKVLLRKQFSISLMVSKDPPREEYKDDSAGTFDSEYLESVNILPYFPNAKYLNLYDANHHLIKKKDIAYLSQTCGDGICQEHESYNDCKLDCDADAQDDFCNMDLKESDPDCNFLKSEDDKRISNQNEKNITETKTNKSSSVQIIIFIIIIFLILLIMILAYYFLIRKKGEKNQN